MSCRCTTCGEEGNGCPGHVGHIELELPIYNPFMMNLLMRFLKSKCYTCHRLKMPPQKYPPFNTSPSRIEDFTTQFLLLKLGHIREA